MVVSQARSMLPGAMQDGHVFLYADSEDEVTSARTTVEAILSEKGIAARSSSWRWHPEEQVVGRTPRLTFPARHLRRTRGRARALGGAWRRGSEQTGYPAWEVRVTLPTHHDARAFAERLGAEGIPVQRHWRHLTLGAEDEDALRAGRALALRGSAGLDPRCGGCRLGRLGSGESTSPPVCTVRRSGAVATALLRTLTLHE